jgi:hypothetical protein
LTQKGGATLPTERCRCGRAYGAFTLESAPLRAVDVCCDRNRIDAGKRRTAVVERCGRAALMRAARRVSWSSRVQCCEARAMFVFAGQLFCVPLIAALCLDAAGCGRF